MARRIPRALLHRPLLGRDGTRRRAMASTLTAPAATPAPPALRRRVRAWDGIRGLAVAAVLAYHLNWRPLRGGFLGVSAFFTLSGFLIASQLFEEIDRTSTV